MNTRNGRLSSRQHDTAARKVQLKDSGDIEEILALAEFEIEHDPYRGIVNTKVPSPWFECRYSENLFGNVSQVVKCSCPSLISWTRELEALKRRRKRKRADLPQLGRRRDDPSFETPCDYNPVRREKSRVFPASVSRCPIVATFHCRSSRNSTVLSRVTWRGHG